MSSTLRILILEDRPDDAELMVYELHRAGLEVEWWRVDTKADYLTHLDLAPEIILADFSLPQFDAPSALRLLQERGLDIPFIMVSGTVGEDLAVNCMKQGATDYLLKDRLARLGQAVIRALEDKSLRVEKRQSAAELKRLKDFNESIVQTMTEGIVVLDAARAITFANPAATEYELEELIIFDPCQTSSPAGQEIRRHELVVRHKDGTPRTLLVSTNPQFSDHGIEGTLIVFTDITERKQALEVIHSLAKFPGENPSPVLRVTRDGILLYANGSSQLLLTLWGCEIGTPIPLQSVVAEVFAAKANREIEVVCDDTIYSLIFTFVADTDYVNIYGRDITERKAAESELAALYNATSFLYKADSLLNLGHQIAEAVVREFSQADCGVLLVDKAQNQLLQLARTGSYVINFTTPIALDEPSFITEAVRTGRLIYAHDVRKSPYYVPGEARTLSELVVPLRISEGIIGVLDLQSDKLDAFSQKDQRVISVFSERAAAALQIMRLYEELNQRAAELEWRVLERTAQLNHAKNRIESILNSSSDIIILCHTDGTISQVNPSFDLAFKCQPDEMLQQPLTSLVIPSHAAIFANAFDKAVATQQSQRLELTICGKEQITFEADVVLSPIVESDPKLQGVVCSLRDITVQKLLLDQAIKLSELKTRYVSMAAHDLRNPLAVIRTSMEIIQHHCDKLTDKQKQAKFDQIQAQITLMIDMLDDILTVGRVEAGKLTFNPASVDLIAFCQSLIADIQLADGARHPINFSSRGICTGAHVDAKLLQHILGNLLSNAIKYSPKQTPVTFTLTCESDQIMFQVQDQGIGIPQDDQARLFEPFHRASNARRISGTGLGLVIVKQSVELHGGVIVFESTEGQGTTFTVTLPQTAR